MQDGYPSKVYIQWFRVIDAYYANNTLPLNVTTIDIADIKSRIMVRTKTVLIQSLAPSQQKHKQTWRLLDMLGASSAKKIEAFHRPAAHARTHGHLHDRY